MKKTILFTGYAPVHFLCFLPIYRRLKSSRDCDVFLSGGFRSKHGDEVTYDIEGFFDHPDVDPNDVITLEEIRARDFDVVVCAHLSDSLFPRHAKRSVQIYHGVSFKNYLVRDKALRYDVLCLPGPYHARKYSERGLLTAGGPEVFMTGFAKTDRLVNGALDRSRLLDRYGFDPSRPVLLYAPTGDKHNSLELYGETILERLSAGNRWSILVKPHDHAKNKIDWFEELARFETSSLKLVHDLDVIPLLHAADLLISDASSVVTEYTLLDRPIVLIKVQKLLKRVVQRGGALDLSSYRDRVGPVVQNPDDIADTVAAQLADNSRYSAARKAIADDVFYRPGTAAERVTGVVRYAAGLGDAPPSAKRLSRIADPTRAA